MTPAVILLLLALGLSLSTLSAVEAPSVPQSPEITFYSSSDLVLLDVVALNAKNGLSDKMLKRDDFQIFDNGHPASIKTFVSGGAIFNSFPRTLVRPAMLHARLRRRVRVETTVECPNRRPITSLTSYRKHRPSPMGCGRRSARIWLLGEQGAVANYIATQTGGQYLWVAPETYAKRLDEILQQLHGATSWDSSQKPGTAGVTSSV
jgi:hypothetical protein